MRRFQPSPFALLALALAVSPLAAGAITFNNESSMPWRLRPCAKVGTHYTALGMPASALDILVRPGERLTLNFDEPTNFMLVDHMDLVDGHVEVRGADVREVLSIARADLILDAFELDHLSGVVASRGPEVTIVANAWGTGDGVRKDTLKYRRDHRPAAPALGLARRRPLFGPAAPGDGALAAAPAPAAPALAAPAAPPAGAPGPGLPADDPMDLAED